MENDDTTPQVLGDQIIRAGLTDRVDQKPYYHEAVVAVQTLIRYIGEQPDRDGLLGTPDRVVRTLYQLTDGYTKQPADILARTFEVDCDEMIVVRNAEFWSLCEHHMLPFHGNAVVGYIPGPRIVGLSKIPRLVQCFAARLQVQERLTQQIADSIMEHLGARGCGVVITASHLCMKMRGIKSSGEMVTSCLRGVIREDPAARAEFLDLAYRGSQS